MQILLLGYGKLGKIIAQMATERGHTIVAAIGSSNRSDLATLNTETIDAAIEFSHPEAAYENLVFCLNHHIPVVCGTTGWLDKKPAIEALCHAQNGTFLYASNFSIGVNIFFKINEFLAKLMAQQPDYEVSMQEVHHTEKKDAPSGTAITLAEGILRHELRKTGWVNQPSDAPQQLYIESLRIDQVPGTHHISWQSKIDEIALTHTAHSREGFAIGALLVAEWIADKKGIFTMDDFLKL